VFRTKPVTNEKKARRSAMVRARPPAPRQYTRQTPVIKPVPHPYISSELDGPRATLTVAKVEDLSALPHIDEVRSSLQLHQRETLRTDKF